ncbi:PLP-dependent aminotransferase family protein [Pseudoclavibacter sp. CFCC 13611]|uniref:aminotransferase-like domain-containing protein n=1 Tax=Pseudoclavibacter sp. CFCC 13611 TaxID=2615178 RepID=UPI001300EB4A|nr:PLP-dependent aminotransferase family protein [Pseudoclavibacter sp. CFCC 13611]
MLVQSGGTTVSDNAIPSTNSSQSSIRLDPWLDQYAERASGLSASEVRALFAVASRPEVVSLAGGMPFVSALPQEYLGDAARIATTTRRGEALQYGSGQGIPHFREQICDIMSLEGIHAHPDDVVVTTGSQHAVDLMSRIFLDPGDVVIAEGPSYVGSLGIFRSYQAETVHVPIDDDGLQPQALRETIARLEKAGRRIKFLYTIPNFHNPAGVTLTMERRREVLDICHQHGILVLEDNPYGLLWFDRVPPEAIRSLDSDGVVYLGSFSKIFAPGFRLGYVLAPHAVREKLVLANESAVLSPTTFGQVMVSEYLEHNDWRGQIDTFRGLYRDRRDAMISALDEFLPTLDKTHPNGGFYIWLSLPEGFDSKEMLPLAVHELVAYTPGTAFYADGTGQDKIRLSFCYPTPAEIRTGIERLSRVVHREQDLLATFGTSRPRTDAQHGVSTPPPDTV